MGVQPHLPISIESEDSMTKTEIMKPAAIGGL